MADRQDPRTIMDAPTAAEQLRRRAEALLAELAAAGDSPVSEGIVDAVHELSVHQIELEMQNEELRSARLELEVQREKYFELFELAPVGYLTLDDKGIADVNVTAARMLGVERRQLLGRSFADFVLAPDGDTHYLHHRALEQTGKPQIYELRLRRAGSDASTETIPGHFWARLDAHRQPTNDGETPRFWLTITDITKSKLAEAALRDNEERYRALLENANDAVYVLALSEGRFGCLLDVNERACRMLGYEREELLGMKAEVIEAPRDQARLADLLDRLQAKGHATFETRHLARNGTRIPVEVSARLFELQGEPTVLAVARDITDRKLATAYAELTRDVLQILNEPGDLRDSIRRVVAVLKARTGFDAVGIRLRDGDDFPYVGHVGFPADHVRLENSLIERAADGLACRGKEGRVNLECTCGMVLSGNTDMFDHALTPGGSFWTNDSGALLGLPADEDPRSNPRNRCIHEGYASVALVPIRDARGIAGLIHMNHRQGGSFSADSIDLLEGIATHVGSALMRKQVEEELRRSELHLLAASRRRERLNAMLNEANARLSASLELGSALDDVLEMACSALGCDAALLGRVVLGEWRVEHAFGLALPDDGSVFDHPPLSTMSPDAPLVFASSDGPHDAWLRTRLGLAEALVTPIPAHRGVAGALLIGRTNGGPGFDDQAIAFVPRLASALALSLANAAQFEAEHHIAETLQEALLVMPARIHGLELSHLYRSATATTRVGGDFFDAFEMDGGRVGVLMGDVSGKGLQAAVLTSIIKDTIKAFAHDEASPAVAVTRANAVLCEAMPQSTFASVFFGVVDGARNRLAYCNAGHPPAAVLAPDGPVRLLTGMSPVIGAIPHVAHDDHVVQLAPQEVVVLYTDGVTEARSPAGVFFEDRRLLSALGSAGAKELAEIPACLLDAVMTFTEGRLTDDIALLAFRHQGAPSPVV